MTVRGGVVGWTESRGTTGLSIGDIRGSCKSRPVEPLGPNVIARDERELAAIDGVGLNDVEMDSVITLVNGFVHGAARGAADASAVVAQTGLTDARWWAAMAPYLDNVFDPAAFPLASRVGAAAGEQHGGAYDFEHAFEFGLVRLLDGVEALINRSRT